MYCARCGKKLEDEDRFCSACGMPVNGNPYGQPGCPYPYQQPYQQPPQDLQGLDPLDNRNGFGLAGFIVSMVSIVLGFMFCMPCIAGIVLSAFGVQQRRSCQTCNRMAVAGLIVGIVMFLFWIVMIIVGLSVPV